MNNTQNTKGYKLIVVNLDTGETEVNTTFRSIIGVLMGEDNKRRALTLINTDVREAICLADGVISEARAVVDQAEKAVGEDLARDIKKLLGLARDKAKR